MCDLLMTTTPRSEKGVQACRAQAQQERPGKLSASTSQAREGTLRDRAWLAVPGGGEELGL